MTYYANGHGLSLEDGTVLPHEEVDCYECGGSGVLPCEMEDWESEVFESGALVHPCGLCLGKGVIMTPAIVDIEEADETIEAEELSLAAWLAA